LVEPESPRHGGGFFVARVQLGSDQLNHNVGMSWAAKSLLIAALVLLAWEHRSTHLSRACFAALGNAPMGLREATAELASLSSYPRRLISPDELTSNWCEALNKPR